MTGEAAAIASRWIGLSANIVDVLAWHKGLCGSCGNGRLCAEYREIIAEYGAGPAGSAVFFPDRSPQG